LPPRPSPMFLQRVRLRTAKILFSLLLLTSSSFTQQENPKSVPHERNLFAEPHSFPLWEHNVPGALGNRDEDNPTLTLYPSVNPRSSGTAVIVAPGGGYVLLAINHEGRQVANWLNSLGVTAFVLKYRLGPKYHHPVELGDAQRAVRLVRFRAKEFGIRPDRIGMMGFSAGGHLASTVGTHFDTGNPAVPDPIDRVSCRPDFLILAYPVISFIAPYSQSKSAEHLLGKNPDPKLLEELSNDLHVTPETPPSFLFSTSTDKVVSPQNSVAFYLALHKAGVPAEIHIFEKGPHGVGLDLADPVLGQWPTLLANWMRERGLLAK
jgi:acetyl esterase/lipase